MTEDELMKQSQQLREAGKPFVVATVVRAESPTSAKPGAKALIGADAELIGWIGGGCAQPAVLDSAKKALQDGQPRLIRISPNKGGDVEPGIIDFGMTCHSGGTLDIFVDPVIPAPALLIIGASPTAQVLAQLASHSGFNVHAAFPGADDDMFPNVRQVIDSYDLQQLSSPTVPWIVVATQGKRDEGGLEAAMSIDSPYVAFVASERKAGKLKDYLKQRGHDAARVDAIVSPAGLEIGATTQEEIAVSILAGLIKARREAQQPEQIMETANQADSCCASQEAVAEETAASCCGNTASMPVSEAIDPVCGMTVNIAESDLVTEYDGKHFYFCCGGCLTAFEKQPTDYNTSVGVSL